MRNQIPLSVPVIRGNEWKYIKECLDTGWVSYAGSYVEKFENIVKEYAGSKYAIATVNGTAALHISLIAGGLCNKDEVIVPSFTFIAPVNTVKYCGAEPVFMDCDPQTLCISIDKIINFLKNNTIQKKDGFAYNKKTKRKIKAIIPVHVFGHPADMAALLRISKGLNIDIIEDATESLGSEYRGSKTGTFGKAGCLSFNGNKIITTGGGGMVLTNDKELAQRIRHLTTQAKTGSIEYDHDEIGYNYRLTNIQAAMGVAQMEKLDEYIGIKRKNALFYKELFSEISELEFLWEKPWAKSNFWYYTVKVPKRHKSRLMNYLLSRGINVRPVWKLINTLDMYKNCQALYIESAVESYNTCFNLPCSVNLKEAEMNFVASHVKRYFKK